MDLPVTFFIWSYGTGKVVLAGYTNKDWNTTMDDEWLAVWNICRGTTSKVMNFCRVVSWEMKRRPYKWHWSQKLRAWCGKIHLLLTERNSRFSRKLTLTVFLDMKGVLLPEFVSSGRTVNSERPATNIQRAICYNDSATNQDSRMLHDNPRKHVICPVREKFQGYGWDILDHHHTALIW